MALTVKVTLKSNTLFGNQMGWLRKNFLLVATIGAVLIGSILGFIVRTQRPSPHTVVLISFPGELLMHMLKMMILPLIVSSLISALAQMDAKQSGRMGSLAVFYYFVTTMLAVILGIILVLTIHPGDPTLKKDLGTATEGQQVSTIDTFLDILRNMFPENIVQATFQQMQTKYVRVRPKVLKKNDTETMNLLNSGALDTLVPSVEYILGMNVLGVIIFCIGFGIIVSQLGEEARLMVEFFGTLDKVIMRFVSYMMLYSPIGIMCLIMGKIVEIYDWAETARMLALYMITVILGLAIHALATLPLIFFFVHETKSIYVYAWFVPSVDHGVGNCVEFRNIAFDFSLSGREFARRSTSDTFCFTVGTINMDGTALYEAVAAIFIAQMNGINLSMGQVFTVSLTATLASIGAASVPSAGLVTMLIVLTAVGLPVKDVSLIVAVDWLLDRIRTSINVLGDAMGAGIVHHYVKDQLALADAEHNRRHSHMERGGAASPVRSKSTRVLHRSLKKTICNQTELFFTVNDSIRLLSLTVKPTFSAALLNAEEKHVGNSTWRPTTNRDGYDQVPQEDIR
ncbi:Excitatory amino acid transporter 2 [Aphelenchoides besseyi]|nr:Excitatory amino acid transporter 2 [Aphelenchoides besseyi]